MNGYNWNVAGSGLEKMFFGQILAILVIIPLVGWIAAIAGLILFLVGLHEAAGADEGYRTAFYVQLATLVLSVLSIFVGALDIFTSILSLVSVYLVCITTANLLSAKGDLAMAARGRLVWKINLACAVVSVVCSVLSIIPVANLLALVIAVPAAIAGLVGGILYLMFLYGSYHSLKY